MASLEGLLDPDNVDKLDVLGNPHVIEQVERFVRLCKPARVSVITDDPEEIAYVRQRALELGEERKLEMEGHTIH